MRLGLRVSDVEGLTMEEKVALAVECRLEAVELSVKELTDHAEARRWKALADEHGLRVSTAGIGIHLCNPELQQEVRSRLERIAEGASLLGGIPLFSRTMAASAALSHEESWRPPVAKEETLEIMALIEAGYEAIARRDAWIEVDRP